jgi:hypothetical protein
MSQVLANNPGGNVVYSPAPYVDHCAMMYVLSCSINHLSHYFN